MKGNGGNRMKNIVLTVKNRELDRMWFWKIIRTTQDRSQPLLKIVLEEEEEVCC